MSDLLKQVLYFIDLMFMCGKIKGLLLSPSPLIIFIIITYSTIDFPSNNIKQKKRSLYYIIREIKFEICRSLITLSINTTFVIKFQGVISTTQNININTTIVDLLVTNYI